MTNERAISYLSQMYIIQFNEKEHESLTIAINSIQENDKLKAEIEQLKEELEQWQSTNLKLVCELTRIECENNQLKSELEQSVKLPCKVGDVVYIVSYYFDCKIDYECRRYDEIGDDCCNWCEQNYKKYLIREEEFKISFIEDIGKTIFLTREEAEQTLRGDAE